MRRVLFTILLLLIFPYVSFAQAPKSHFYYESDYQQAWCAKHQGKTEVVLSDKARVDCVTKTHAIEFDFAQKWAESIGQSLYYSEALNKTPGIVLIVENKDRDRKYVNRVKTVTDKFGITLWLMHPEDMKR